MYRCEQVFAEAGWSADEYRIAFFIVVAQIVFVFREIGKMNILFKNAMVWNSEKFEKTDAVFSDGAFIKGVFPVGEQIGFSVLSECLILPGFCDVHVHLREPGFSYKETIKSGTLAGARGGYTALCSMPNLKPVPDTGDNLKIQTELIKKNAVIPVYPYGALTVEEKGEYAAELEEMSEMAIAFSDDGRGIQSEAMMRELMLRAKRLGKTVVAHCEDNSLLNGGYIHDGEYAKAHGHRGICSRSEWLPIERDLKLCEETGCSYHVCHISAKESVELIRKAKKRGLDVTCETAPHYLVLNDGDLCEDGRFKMNPPIRSEEDRLALIEGINDGTVDMIATDHAPHSEEEKSRGLEGSLFGIVGLETAFPILYTKLVKKGLLSLERLVELLSIAPRRRFNINSDAGFCVWDIKNEYEISPETFYSKGRSTPFEQETVFGKNLLTVYNGECVYKNL